MADPGTGDQTPQGHETPLRKGAERPAPIGRRSVDDPTLRRDAAALAAQTVNDDPAKIEKIRAKLTKHVTPGTEASLEALDLLHPDTATEHEAVTPAELVTFLQEVLLERGEEIHNNIQGLPEGRRGTVSQARFAIDAERGSDPATNIFIKEDFDPTRALTPESTEDRSYTIRQGRKTWNVRVVNGESSMRLLRTKPGEDPVEDNVTDAWEVQQKISNAITYGSQILEDAPQTAPLPDKLKEKLTHLLAGGKTGRFSRRPDNPTALINFTKELDAAILTGEVTREQVLQNPEIRVIVINDIIRLLSEFNHNEVNARLLRYSQAGFGSIDQLLTEAQTALSPET